ncbi:hypothetical protein ACMU_14155 [Actibacterium mucosum KCTC 23349]|uniref:Haloacid dehalogenase n=1 Tax=Actibacterium mucosum KCTC 23349 TaxID=1454373 RepID=A0A037ZFM0_9RHOB|nr:HAD family phosphatase [Actibacterium mucosum]KAJ54903.1 hypothetical protein ACMU_14155 [Actibacterium mucosum KCTC 23349]
MTPSFAAVIFDLDGTLLDTEASNTEASLAAMRAFGLPPDEAFLELMIGRDYETCEAMMAERYPGIDLAAYGRVLTTELERVEAAGFPLKPDVREVLGDLQAAGKPLALVTSSRRSRADLKLSRAGLTDFFSVTVTLDDVTAAKPDPAPYALAAQQLGVAPDTCLVFEDSETGVASALGAGMKVVQVPDMLPAGGHAHVTADTLWAGAHSVGLPVRAAAPCESAV